jgi:hypothetical protein
MSDVRRYRGLSDAHGPFADSFVLASDYDAAIRRAEEAERDLRLCRGHDLVAKFRMLAAERDDMLDKLIAERTRRAALRAALRRIYFLDHNEREWESVDEIKQFARAALAAAETEVKHE